MYHALNEDKDSDLPWEWLVSRVCEEFNCLPAEAVHALDNDSDRLILGIIGMRAFARAKEIWDSSKDKKNLPQSRMMDLVIEIEFDAIRKMIKGDAN